MRHTFFGNLPGHFESSGWHLLVRGLPLWAFTVVPFAIGAVATILAVDWSALNSISGADVRATWTEANGLAGIDVIVALTGAWLRVQSPSCIRFFTPSCCAGGYLACASGMLQ